MHDDRWGIQEVLCIAQLGPPFPQVRFSIRPGPFFRPPHLLEIRGRRLRPSLPTAIETIRYRSVCDRALSLRLPNIRQPVNADLWQYRGVHYSIESFLTRQAIVIPAASVKPAGTVPLCQ